jgi:CHASE2 domain-containing sensor protein
VARPAAAGDAVVIVALDDETIAEAPSLVERREGAAAMIRAVAGYGPAAIGIDGLTPTRSGCSRRRWSRTSSYMAQKTR